MLQPLCTAIPPKIKKTEVYALVVLEYFFCNPPESTWVVCRSRILPLLFCIPSCRHADEAHELSLQNLAQLEMRIFELEICFNKVS